MFALLNFIIFKFLISYTSLDQDTWIQLAGIMNHGHHIELNKIIVLSWAFDHFTVIKYNNKSSFKGCQPTYTKRNNISIKLKVFNLE